MQQIQNNKQINIKNNIKSKENIIIVLFNLDGQSYALSLFTVDRIIPIVEITSLPKASEIVMGVINFHGEVIQVVNIRKLFNLPVRAIELNDQLIIAHTSKKIFALVVDSVPGTFILDCCQIADTEKTLPGTDYLSGIAKVENNIVMILDEQKVMQEALNTG